MKDVVNCLNLVDHLSLVDVEDIIDYLFDTIDADELREMFLERFLEFKKCEKDSYDNDYFRR